MKAWLCALAILLACTQPTSSGAYYEYVPPPQPPAERQGYKVVKTVKVWATKYFIPKRSEYSTEKEFRRAMRMEGGSKTATGEDLSIGHIAANLRRFKLGTTVRIKEASGLIGVIEDTGGAMRANPNQIDIFTDSKEDAERWGRRKVTMEILERVRT